MNMSGSSKLQRFWLDLDAKERPRPASQTPVGRCVFSSDFYDAQRPRTRRSKNAGRPRPASQTPPRTLTGFLAHMACFFPSKWPRVPVDGGRENLKWSTPGPRGHLRVAGYLARYLSKFRRYIHNQAVGGRGNLKWGAPDPRYATARTAEYRSQK
ncbi:hypothetical protein L2E82_26903 [Cichorium intybus]|uniref:Uncharacterized protein n=1 Tax=Cichorium intybus TaxID=13427 RepID=A0ACB9CRN1_CICIN|nr:hypothetical protein L2E82_26903 [Cichorium intybus]